MEDDENGRRFTIEPKEEIIEEDDTNSENYEKSHTPGMEGCVSESDSGYDNRPIPNYYHHPAVETGMTLEKVVLNNNKKYRMKIRQSFGFKEFPCLS